MLAGRLAYLNREEARVRRFWLSLPSKEAKLRSIQAQRESLQARLAGRQCG